ncbi:MAG: beta-hydroxyacyl-ACP dehydratase, partial [Oscillospiraceae bacterium]|nr:beta-hydroxyacyl-ACP dehydratase [Oscillospiraceae bacterium]
EILAQSVCVLLADCIDDNKLPMYTGLNNVRFRSPVRPGDVFETKCRIKRAKPPFYFAEGKGYVGDRLSVEAEFSFVVTE